MPLVNHIRIPALASGLLLLFLPGVIHQGQTTYLAATGQTQELFLTRWLLLTGLFFAASTITYAIRLARVHLRRHRRRNPWLESVPAAEPAEALTWNQHSRRQVGPEI